MNYQGVVRCFVTHNTLLRSVNERRRSGKFRSEAHGSGETVVGQLLMDNHQEDNCIFCKIARKEAPSVPVYVESLGRVLHDYLKLNRHSFRYEDDHVVAFMGWYYSLSYISPVSCCS
jgi:hypothetical protein